jgi:hypothetical protein
MTCSTFSSFRIAILCGALLLAPIAAVFAADNTRGAVEQSDGNVVSQNPVLPKLNLNEAQREQIRQALLTKNNEVEFKLKATKLAKNFTPAVGAKLPSGVKPDGLPSDLIGQIPQLRDYGYAKMKDQILIVNELSGKIVEIIPETQPQTTGQR